jgi:hypothetical protein
MNYRSTLANPGVFQTDIRSLSVRSSFIYTASELVSDLQVNPVESAPFLKSAKYQFLAHKNGIGGLSFFFNQRTDRTERDVLKFHS